MQEAFAILFGINRLLGIGSTGKSTLFKSLQMVHNGGAMEKEDKIFERRLIRINILDVIQTLIRQCNILYSKNPIIYKNTKLELDESLKPKVDKLVNEIKSSFFDESKLNSKQLASLAETIDTVWKLACIQETFSFQSGNFAVSDNMEHFFNQIDKIMDANYIPSEEDCLKNRSMTVGMLGRQDFFVYMFANFSLRNVVFAVVLIVCERCLI